MTKSGRYAASRSAQEIEQLFRGLLLQLGWTVPATK